MSIKSMYRPLHGLAIGISISEADDLPRYGLIPGDVNSVTVELCRRLIALGAGVCLGHQWRPGGVMEAVARLARTYQGEISETIIHNFLAWPDRAALSDSDRGQLGKLVEIHNGQDVRAYDLQDHRAAALRQMRMEMALTSQASIGLSGRLRPAQGASPEWVPGLVEEVALMLDQPTPRPVYLSRMMGGAAAFLVDLIDQREVQADLHGPIRLSRYVHQLSRIRKENLAKICGLLPDELTELFNAHNVDTVISLTAKGLGRLSRTVPGFSTKSL
jgi:SLOG cluster2